MNRDTANRFVLLLLAIFISAIFLSMIRSFLMAIFLAGIFSALARPLYIHIQHQIFFSPGFVLHLIPAGSIEMAMYLRPFHETARIGHPSKRGFVEEMVIASVYLTLAFMPGRV